VDGKCTESVSLSCPRGKKACGVASRIGVGVRRDLRPGVASRGAPTVVKRDFYDTPGGPSNTGSGKLVLGGAPPPCSNRRHPARRASTAAAAAREPDPDERLIGTRLGPYRVEAIAGHGGMGAVYRASRDDAEFRQQVAIKLVRVVAESPDTLRRFRQERQILARLSHSNIARLLDGGSATMMRRSRFCGRPSITGWHPASISPSKRTPISNRFMMIRASPLSSPMLKSELPRPRSQSRDSVAKSGKGRELAVLSRSFID
jgi:hypothetical protein